MLVCLGTQTDHLSRGRRDGERLAWRRGLPGCAASLDVSAIGGLLLIVQRTRLTGCVAWRRVQEEAFALAKEHPDDPVRSLVRTGILELAPASERTRFPGVRLTAKGRDLFYVVRRFAPWGPTLLEPGESAPRSSSTRRRQAHSEALKSRPGRSSSLA